MINKRKVRLMTRTAMYEKHECSNDINKAKYYKSDYVGLHMWTTAIAVTIAYIIILMLVMSCNFEFIINNLTGMWSRRMVSVFTGTGFIKYIL